jgi:hypothetical protein
MVAERHVWCAIAVLNQKELVKLTNPGTNATAPFHHAVDQIHGHEATITFHQRPVPPKCTQNALLILSAEQIIKC